MLLIKWGVVAIIGAVVALLLAAQLGLNRGPQPDNLGVREGKLKRPSKTPNSVSSQADLWPGDAQQAYARIAPLALRGDGPATIARLKSIAESMPGAEVAESRPDYLYVRFSTRLMRYVDDTEFWFDPAANAVQVRSASRVGRKDYGANRQRVEAIRARLAAA